MEIKQLVVGPLATNCYLVSVDDELVAVDPGEDVNKILEQIEKINKKLKYSIRTAHYPTKRDAHPKLKYIVLTHYHFDHVLVAQELKNKTGAMIVIHEKDKDFLDFSADSFLKDKEIIKIGQETLKVIHSPGHTQGSICLLAKNEIFVGDLIFAEGYGRTDLEGGSDKEMENSLKKISKILKLGMMVYPGHGESFMILSEAQADKIGRAM